jgi:methylated-DNA-protein-cysteine methyltransferase-like protein
MGLLQTLKRSRCYGRYNRRVLPIETLLRLSTRYTPAVPYDPAEHGPERIVGPGFFERVYEVVTRVPPGRVTTYGDVAAFLGLRSVARKVGHALAALPNERRDVPWFRVVNSKGSIARDPSTGAGREQAVRLRAEGVDVDQGGKVREFARRRYVP